MSVLEIVIHCNLCYVSLFHVVSRLEVFSLRVPKMTSTRLSVHEGVTCNACRRADFRGKRYKCLICYDYDLCETCYEEGVTEAAHKDDHAVQCILTPADFELYYAGEPAHQPQSFTCPLCATMGFTLAGLRDHVSSEHIEDTTRVVCPVCAATPGGAQNHVTGDLAGHLITGHARSIDDLDDDESASQRPQRVSEFRFGETPVPGGQPQRQLPPTGTILTLSPPDSDPMAAISGLLSRVSTGARRPALRVSGATTTEIQQELRRRLDFARQQIRALEQQQQIRLRAYDRLPAVSMASSIPTAGFSEPVAEVPKPTLVEPPAPDDPRFLLNRLIEARLSQSQKQALEVERADRSLFVQELLLSTVEQVAPVGASLGESRSSAVTQNGDVLVQDVTTPPDPTGTTTTEPKAAASSMKAATVGAESTAATSPDPDHVANPEPAVRTSPQSAEVPSQETPTTTSEPGAGDLGATMTASGAPTSTSPEPNSSINSGLTGHNPNVDRGQLPSSK